MARDSIMAAARTVDVQTFLNEHPFSRFQWMIFGLCFWVVLSRRDLPLRISSRWS